MKRTNNRGEVEKVNVQLSASRGWNDVHSKRPTSVERFNNLTWKTEMLCCVERSGNCNKMKWKICTYIRSVSCGIFRGTVDNPRCEQSTVLPVHEHSRGHFDVNMLSPPNARPLRLKLDAKCCEPNGSAATSHGKSSVVDTTRSAAKIVVNIFRCE